LADSSEWPSACAKVFIDDSLGDRVWVDRVDSAQYVANILTAFNTRSPSDVLRAAAELSGPPTTMTASTSSPSIFDGIIGDAEIVDCSTQLLPTTTIDDVDDNETLGGVRTRFVGKRKDDVISWTQLVLRDWWTRRLDTAPKNLLKTMCACCGMEEVRLIATQKLDVWLQNAKVNVDSIV
jgi:integrator complex subunit 1